MTALIVLEHHKKFQRALMSFLNFWSWGNKWHFCTFYLAKSGRLCSLTSEGVLWGQIGVLMESALQIPLSRLPEHLCYALLHLQPTDSSSGRKLQSSTSALSTSSTLSTVPLTKFPTSFATKNKRKTPFWGGQWYIFIFHVQAKMMEIWSISWCVCPRLRPLQLSFNDWGAGRMARGMETVNNHYHKSLLFMCDPDSGR